MDSDLPKRTGGDMRDVFAVGCLIIGIGLVGLQVFLSLWSKREPTTKAMKTAAASVSAAAAKVSEAATKADLSRVHVNDAHRALIANFPDAASTMADSMRDTNNAVDQAKQVAASAEDAANEAAKGVDSLTGLLGDLSGKLPIAVLGLVFILAGAWIYGLIDFSMAATSK
jgi:hypothetical protein